MTAMRIGRAAAAVLACALAAAGVRPPAAAQAAAGAASLLEEHEIDRGGKLVRLVKYGGQLYRKIQAKDLRSLALDDAPLHGLLVCVEGKFDRLTAANTFRLIGSDRQFAVADRKAVAGIIQGDNVWLGGHAQRLGKEPSCFMAVSVAIPLPGDVGLFNQRFAKYSREGSWQRLLDLGNWIEVSGRQAAGMVLQDTRRYRQLKDRAIREALKIRDRTLADNDAEGLYEQARLEVDLLGRAGRRSAIKHLHRAVEADPAHKGATELFGELGHRFFEGRYRTEAEIEERLGERVRTATEGLGIAAEKGPEEGTGVGVAETGQGRERVDLRERLEHLLDIERQIRVIRTREGDEIIKAVAESIKEEDDAVARRIVWILANMAGISGFTGGHAALLMGQDSPSTAVRRDVADALVWGGHAGDVADMIRGERDPGVRSHAVDALASVPTQKSLGALVSLASLKDEGTRSRVNAALQRLTRQAFSEAGAWSTWWEANKAAFPAAMP